MPDITYDSQESIPEGLRDYAAKDETSGKFVVKVAPAAKLTEFRDNNTNLLRERDELKNVVSRYASVVGENPDEAAEEISRLRTTAQQVEDGKLKGSEAIEKEVSARVKQMEESYKTQIQELGAKTQTLEQREREALNKFRQSVLDREITNAVLAKDSAANPDALPDIRSRAARVFTVNEKDQLVAMDGDAVVYGSDGITPMRPKEWLDKVIEEAPYLARTSAGGGAAGNRGDEKYGGLGRKEFEELPAQKRMELYRASKRAG